jgi:hypothetical protein
MATLYANDEIFIEAEPAPTKEEPMNLRLHEVQERLHEISIWLSDNDWKINKVFLGEWSTDDPRWLEYLETRAAMRAEYDELIKEV